MRRILTILCALALVATLLSAAALLAQHHQRSRGQPFELPTAGLTPRPANLYGVNIALLSTEPSSRDAALEIAAINGFGWVRQTFQWREYGFDWEATDELVDAVIAHKLRLIAVLDGERAPEDPVTFAKFAARFARRYADAIDVYQIWDEPNLQSAWGEAPSAAAYGRLLVASHAAIHQADTHSTVLLAGLAPTVETGPENISDLLFLRELYAVGAGPFFDAAAGKPYAFNSTPDERSLHPKTLNFSRFILLRAEMERQTARLVRMGQKLLPILRRLCVRRPSAQERPARLLLCSDARELAKPHEGQLQRKLLGRPRLSEKLSGCVRQSLAAI